MDRRPEGGRVLRRAAPSIMKTIISQLATRHVAREAKSKIGTPSTKWHSYSFGPACHGCICQPIDTTKVPAKKKKAASRANVDAFAPSPFADQVWCDSAAASQSPLPQSSVAPRQTLADDAWAEGARRQDQGSCGSHGAKKRTTLRVPRPPRAGWPRVAATRVAATNALTAALLCTCKHSHD